MKPIAELKPCKHSTHVEGCRVCYWFADTSPKGQAYRAKWDPTKQTSRVTRTTQTSTGHCIHLGVPTGETKPCKGCNKTTEVPLLHCTIHTVCTEKKLLPQIACCRICPDNEQYQPSSDKEGS